MDLKKEFLVFVLEKYIILKKIKISVQRPLKGAYDKNNLNLAALNTPT